MAGRRIAVIAAGGPRSSYASFKKEGAFMKRLFLLAAVLAVATGARAQQAVVPPNVMVEDVTNQVLDIVRHDKAIQQGDTRRVIQLVDAKVLPHFDFRRMTALAMGFDWRRATPQQQATLVDQFRALLVRTYSVALTSYRDQTIVFRPLRLDPAASDVTVRTLIEQPGGRPIGLDYSLEKTDSGWKVYDIAVGGVSLVTNYRSEFASAVHQAGIDGLIKQLEAKNRNA
jgi:phospholipid transport system substrate-binding protein